MTTNVRIGDVVVRVRDVGTRRALGSMEGVVLRVVPVRGAGGVRAKLRVRWANGFEASVDDRQVAVVRRGARDPSDKPADAKKYVPFEDRYVVDLTEDEVLAIRDTLFRVAQLTDLAESQYFTLANQPQGIADASVIPVAETYLVAADAAAEGGFSRRARELRGYARRYIVVDWARRKWSRDRVRVLPLDVDPMAPSPNGETNRFRVFRPSRAGWFEVLVDRRGRVRITRDRTI